MIDGRRSLPSVSSLLESDGVRALLEREPRSVVVDAIRRTIDQARSAPESAPATAGAWTEAITSAIAESTRPSLRRVINGTGVVL
ncbi:MAG: L-seryl-tRNA(Sec) selenium transferase, partial [Solirubrobacteraceae bacterium]